MSYSEVEIRHLEWALLLKERPSFLGAGRARGAKLSGLAYEKRAQQYLEERFNGLYIRGPWIAYKLRHEKQVRFCQPDGIYFNFPQLYVGIIELKLKHTAEAYWQIKNLYEPLLRKIFSEHFTFRAIEMCKWFDGTDYFPCEPIMVNDLELFPKNGFGVHIWRP